VLFRSKRAYLEHTLAPYHLRRNTGQGVVVLMPRFLDYTYNRFPAFDRYLILHQRVHLKDFIHYESEPTFELWVDPTSPEINGDRLGLLFHCWLGEEEYGGAVPRMVRGYLG
jgi:CRISPR-associated protein Cas5t